MKNPSASDTTLLHKSPTHSILSNKYPSDKSLCRNKSLKRVSFDEKPDIIVDSVCDTGITDNCVFTEEARSSTGAEAGQPLQEIPIKVKPIVERSPTPPLNMAAAEEQIEIPTDGGDGEPVMPKKERKPHIKGITFREFDVRNYFICFIQSHKTYTLRHKLCFLPLNYLQTQITSLFMAKQSTKHLEYSVSKCLTLKITLELEAIKDIRKTSFRILIMKL